MVFNQQEDIGCDVVIVAEVTMAQEATFDAATIDRVDTSNNHRTVCISGALFCVQSLRSNQCAVARVGIKCDLVADLYYSRRPFAKVVDAYIRSTQYDVSKKFGCSRVVQLAQTEFMTMRLPIL